MVVVGNSLGIKVVVGTILPNTDFWVGVVKKKLKGVGVVVIGNKLFKGFGEGVNESTGRKFRGGDVVVSKDESKVVRAAGVGVVVGVVNGSEGGVRVEGSGGDVVVLGMST